MANRKQAAPQDLVARLTGAGSEAMQRLGDLPGGKALAETAQAFRERLDELATRIRAIDPLEKRITALEKRVGALEKKQPARKRTAAAKPKAQAKKG